jgi:hypothetical protein
LSGQVHRAALDGDVLAGERGLGRPGARRAVVASVPVDALAEASPLDPSPLDPSSLEPSSREPQAASAVAAPRALALASAVRRERARCSVIYASWAISAILATYSHEGIGVRVEFCAIKRLCVVGELR